jgi:hypothetical protein
VATVIDELVTVLSIETNSASKGALKSMSEGLGNMMATGLKLATALAGVATAAVFAAAKFNKSSAEVGKLSDLTGISTDTIQKWGYAIEQSGGNVESIQGDLASLTKSMSSPVYGEFNDTMLMLGISSHNASGGLKTADEILLEFSDKIKGMPKQTQLQWASKLGISNETLLLLQKGRGEIGKYFDLAKKDGAIIDEQSIANARQFNADMARLWRIFQSLGQEISAKLAPAFRTFVEIVAGFMERNREKIVNFFDAMLKGFSSAIEWISGFVTSADSLLGGFFDRSIEESSQLFDRYKSIWNAILDVVTEVVSIIMELVGANMEDIRNAYAVITEEIFGFLEGLHDAIAGIAKFLKDHREDIVGFFQGVVDVIKVAVDYVWKLYEGAKALIGMGKEKMDQWGVTGAVEKTGEIASSIAGAVKSGIGSLFGPGEAQASQGGGFDAVKKAKPVATASSTQGKVDQAMQYYMSQGLSKEKAAAIVGNLQHESSLQTGATGDKNKPEHSWAHGIGQWRDNEKRPGTGRFTDLKKFAEQRGTSWEDYETQLAFVLHEMQTTEKPAGGKFASAKGIEGSTLAMSKYYERPDEAHAGNEHRIQLAQAAAARAPNITINNTITTNDPYAAALAATDKMNASLQTHFPGPTAPGVQ